MAADPQDPRAPYYLGNLLYDLQPERAIAEWERSRALDPGFARVHRNLAFAYARARGDLAAAAASQEKAVALEKREPRLYYELDQYLAWTRAPLATRLARLTESPETVASREITAGRLARVQVLLGRRRRRARDARPHALPRLGGRERDPLGLRGGAARAGPPPPGEGRRARRRSRSSAATVDVPANIEVGHGVGAHLAAVHHHVGLALEALGRKDEAAAAFRESAGVPAVVARGALLDRPVAREARPRRRRPAATSSASPRRSRGPWTPRGRSRCGWRRARAGARTST